MSSPRRETEDVLGEVLLNANALAHGVQPGGEQDDEDFALAKLLQEQERAYWQLAAGGLAAENHPPAAAAAAAAAELGAGSPVAGGANSAAEGEEAELDDEELARRLQAEEDAEHYRQLLAMAGVVPGNAEEEEEFEDDPVDPDNMTYEELSALGEVVGTVSKGISQEQINALPVKRYCEVAGPEGACADEQCAVCRVEYTGEDEVRVLPCNHYYHPDCVGAWLQHNKICPVCSKEVVSQGKQS